MTATPNTAALRALLERVEAGEWDMFPGVADAVGIHNAALAGSAYRGSLDAAKALHEAVLGDGNISTPGYMATVYMSGKAAVWDIISGASHHGEVNAPNLHAVSPARAWLIAILRALIATPDTEGR